MSGEVKREPIEDRWKSTLWENNPELLEYTSSLEQKLKIAEDKLEWIKDINERYLTDDDDDPSNHIDRLVAEAMSAIREE